MSPKFDENSLAQEIVDAALKQYKDKLLNGKEYCVAIVQVNILLTAFFKFNLFRLEITCRRLLNN